MEKHIIDYDDEDIISDKTFFVLMDSKESRKICNCSMGKLRLSKHDIDLRFFYGKKINTFWELDEESNKYIEIQSNDYYKEDLIEGEDIDYNNEKISNANNKEIYSSSAEDQLLKLENINEIKKLGLKSDELINEIIATNQNMAKRTLLSQQKILKRMEIRHKYQIHLAKPTLFNLVETFFLDRYQFKIILHMRFDTVSTILQNINFFNKAKSIIYDDTNGFLTSVIASRTSNTILNVFDGRPNQRMMSFLNLSDSKKEKISYLEIKNFKDESPLFGLLSNQYKEAFTNLVICNKDETKLMELLSTLYFTLKSSGLIIIYARDKEYLIQIEKILFENKLALNINVCETYMREYQVLPLRTHPMMNNKGFSNYVLTGVKFTSNLEE